MRVGELSAVTGASVRSIRYYEQSGLLESRRSPGGQRVFEPPAVDRVRRIRALIAAGIPVHTIRKFLPCIRDADGSAVTKPDHALIRDLVSERERLLEKKAAVEDSLAALDLVIEHAAGDQPYHEMTREAR